MRYLEIGAPAGREGPRWPVLAGFDLAVATAARGIVARIQAGLTERLAEAGGEVWDRLLAAQPRARRRRGAAMSDLRFAEAQRAVAADPDGLRSARDLAARTGASLDGLDRSFLEAFGVSAAGYLDAARLRQARRMLCRGGRPVAEVAAASGIASHAHMTDRMRARLGATPSQLRRLSA